MSEEEQLKKINEATMNFITEIEKEKLYYFMLLSSNPCNVVCVKSPEKKAIKDFLGYEWSDTKGNEGIKYINVKVEKSEDDEDADDTIEQIKGINGIQTPLFNPNDFDDVTKINTIIRSNFETGNASVPENLAEYVKTLRLVDMIDFSRASFDKAIRTNVQSEKAKIESKWPLVKLGEIAEIKKGKSITSADVQEGPVKVVAGGIDFAYLHNEANRPENIITVSASGANAGFVNFWKEPIFASDCTTIIANDLLITKYIYNILKTYQQYVFKLQKGQAQPHVYADDLKLFVIPNPPLDIQQNIVEECEAVDKEYQEAEKQVEECKEKISSIMENVQGEQKKLGDIYKISSGGTPSRKEPSYWMNGTIPWLTTTEVTNELITTTKEYITEEGLKNSSTKIYPKESLVIAMYGQGATRGRTAKLGIETTTNQACAVLYEKLSDFNTDYIWFYLKSQYERLRSISHGSAQPNLTAGDIFNFSVSLPPLAEQQKIVEQIAALEEQIAAAKKIMANAPQRKQAVLDKWL